MSTRILAFSTPSSTMAGTVVEIVIVLAILGAFLAIGALVTLVSPVLLIMTGFWAVVGGMAVGTPAGFYYHVKLYKALRDELPRRWWLHPTNYNARLPEQVRGGVMIWFYLGAAGWGVTVLGCVLVLFGGLASG